MVEGKIFFIIFCVFFCFEILMLFPFFSFRFQLVVSFIYFFLFFFIRNHLLTILYYRIQEFWVEMISFVMKLLNNFFIGMIPYFYIPYFYFIRFGNGKFRYVMIFLIIFIRNRLLTISLLLFCRIWRFHVKIVSFITKL